MVDEVLVPGPGVRGREAAEADGEEVHVQKGDLGPGFEGWGELEGCCWSERAVLTLVSQIFPSDACKERGRKR